MPTGRLLCGLWLVGLAACGGRGVAGQPDGGGDTAPPVAGLRSFDVFANVTPMSAMPPGTLPSENRFTLVLDAEARRMLVGGVGQFAVVPLTSTDGRTFRAATGFTVGVVSTSQCAGLTSLRYDALDFTVTGSTFTGTSKGAGNVSCGDCMFSVPFSASLTGGPDVTAPFLIISGAAPTSPFYPFHVFASEPLLPASTARLTASDGSHVDLVPTLAKADVEHLVDFSKPSVVLRPGMGYLVEVAGLVDFAGRTGASEAPLRLGSFPTVPLVAEDGFESATGAVGGATLVETGLLPPIAGARSVYLGTSAPAAPGLTPGAALRVRLPVAPGDTKLRFSYRYVSEGEPGFAGRLRFGSAGGEVGTGGFLAVPAESMLKWPDGKTVSLSQVKVMELPLPAGVADELLVAIETSSFSCGPFFGGGGGLLVDDLRVE